MYPLMSQLGVQCCSYQGVLINKKAAFHYVFIKVSVCEGMSVGRIWNKWNLLLHPYNLESFCLPLSSVQSPWLDAAGFGNSCQVS